MSELTIHMNLDNAAFEGEECGPEVARILRAAADHIERCSRGDLDGTGSCALRDSNGNTVGSVEFEIDDDDEDDEEAAVERLVNDMSREDIIVILEDVCGIQCYDTESDFTLRVALRNAIADGDVSTSGIVSHFEGRYS